MNKKESIRDFAHFLGIEEENVVKNIANFGDDFFLALNLDILYRMCLELGPIDKPELKIPTFLFLNSHREFYLGIASFFRLHQSKSFCSLRSALDSVFTASYLIKHSEKTQGYLSKLSGQEKKEWNRIFLNIKETIKKGAEFSLLEKSFTKIHEFCSVYSHSDALGIMQRYNVDKERLFLSADYFDYEDSVADYKKWFGCLLYGFSGIFLIFWNEIFKEKAGDKLETIEQRFFQFNEKLKLFMQKYPVKELQDQDVVPQKK